MDKPHNKYIAVSYKLYSVDEDGDALVEEASEERPFQFISGLGITLDEFERHIASLEKGAGFDFTLDKSEAYGDYEEERVLDLDRDIFCINGHFDHDNIYIDAMVPLQNEDGNRLYGRVLDITDDKVKMDLNHPLAGMTLHFIGKVMESRDATNEEIQAMLKRISGGCHCKGEKDCDCHGDSNCGCGEHHHGDCHCDDHHHHHDDCGCGHCH